MGAFNEAEKQRAGAEPGPSASGWAAALVALTRGEAVGFPTETVWGLGVDAASSAAVAGLTRLKGRPPGKALQVCCASAARASALAAPNQPLFDALCAHLPGPLTLVVRAAETCPAWLSFEGQVGLRVPDHPLILALLERWGGPLATSSLNPAGQPSARTLAEAQHYGLASVLLDNSDHIPLAGLPSTVVDCTTGKVLRQGAFPLSALRPLLALAGEKGT